MSFSQKILKWYDQHKRELPWRATTDPYKIWLSEIMLQQTTVGTVLNHYDKFLVEYPSLKKLANASEEQICISWKGLHP
jgi:A/G-specific adenine glycosylase